MPDGPDHRAAPGVDVAELVGAVPGLVRLGVAAVLRPGLELAGDALTGAAQITRIVEATLRGERDPADAAAEIVEHVEARLGQRIQEGEARIVQRFETPPPPTLAERGAALLARSADPAPPPEDHPGFGAVLDQLAPDEMRVLRLLRDQGPQPAVDVVAVSTLGREVRTVARNLSLIGRMAGCRCGDRVPAYLENLERLGLVRVEPTAVDVTEDYEMLEVEPSVVEAEEAASRLAGRARSERRAIELTRFGEWFCAACVPEAAS